MKSDTQPLGDEVGAAGEADGAGGEADRADVEPGAEVAEVAEERATSFVPLAMVVLLIAFVGVRWGLPLLLMIVGVILMIAIHELGHFLTAKWSGMKVTEYFIGFGPKIWSFRRGETEYGIKAVPAGAYVRIIGMNNLDEVPPEDEARSYRQQSFPKRLLVVLAGPATHLVQAFVILMVMFTLVGVPGGEPLGADPGESPDWMVDEVTDDSAASAAGLEPGDRIVAFDGNQVKNWNDVRAEIAERDVGEEVTLTIERDGERFESTTELTSRPVDVDGDRTGPFLGVGPQIPQPEDEKLGVIPAVGRSVTETGDVTWQSLVAMSRFFSPDGLNNYADTVGQGSGTTTDSGGSGGAPPAKVEEGGDRMLSILGVVRLGADAGEEGLKYLLPIFLMINVFVGMINLVPLLPFDGGHAVVAIYERVRSRNGHRYHADVSKLLPVAYAVVMGLVILGVTSLYLDIVNPI